MNYRTKNLMAVIKFGNPEKYKFIMELGGYDEMLNYEMKLKNEVIKIYEVLETQDKISEALNVLYIVENTANNRKNRKQTFNSFLFDNRRGSVGFTYLKKMIKLNEMYKSKELHELIGLEK